MLPVKSKMTGNIKARHLYGDLMLPVTYVIAKVMGNVLGRPPRGQK